MEIFISCLYVFQSALSLVWQNIAQTLSLCLKGLMGSALIQGWCLPLTFDIFQGACLSITWEKLECKTSQASWTLGIDWYLSHLIEKGLFINRSTLIFLCCLILIDLGGHFGILIFHTYTIDNWMVIEAVWQNTSFNKSVRVRDKYPIR